MRRAASILQVFVTMVSTISIKWLSLLRHVGPISFKEATLKFDNKMVNQMLKKFIEKIV